MRFSVGLLGHISSAYDIAATADLAALAERLGYCAYWVADNRWHRDVWVTLTACAMRTERISLGPRVTDPYIRHPALTAVAIASLDELSGGRAVLGIGAGGTGFPQLGIERRRPVPAIREAVELTRMLLGRGLVDYQGETVSFRRGALGFSARAGIPVLVGGRGPKILSLAGEIADMAMAGCVASDEGVRWARAQVDRGIRRAGRGADAVELCAMTYVAVTDRASEAREAVRIAVAQAVGSSYPVLDFVTAAGLEIPPQLRALIASGVREPARLAPLIPDAFVDRLAIAGDTASSAAQLSRMAAAGLQHVIVAPIPVREPAQIAIERFAREVMPRVVAG